MVKVYQEKNEWQRIEERGDKYRFYRMEKKKGKIRDREKMVKEEK